MTFLVGSGLLVLHYHNFPIIINFIIIYYYYYYYFLECSQLCQRAPVACRQRGQKEKCVLIVMPRTGNIWPFQSKTDPGSSVVEPEPPFLAGAL